MTLYQSIVAHLAAFKKGQKLADLVNKLPYGCSLRFNINESEAGRLVFELCYRQIDDGTGTDFFTHHKIIIGPAPHKRFKVKVTGPNRNHFRDELHDAFQHALEEKEKEE